MLSPSSAPAVEDASVTALCQIFKTTASLKKNKKKHTRMGKQAAGQLPSWTRSPRFSFWKTSSEVNFSFKKKKKRAVKSRTSSALGEGLCSGNNRFMLR